eukprot:4269361-Prymnesium_polylepis.1
MPSRLSFDLSRPQASASPLCRAGASRPDLSCPQHPHSALRFPHSVVQRLPHSAIHFRGFPLCHADASRTDLSPPTLRSRSDHRRLRTEDSSRASPAQVLGLTPDPHPNQGPARVPILNYYY